MLGSIIGDIVGSRFEFNNLKGKKFELFTKACSFTDDTICTVAVADAILKGIDYGESIHAWCRRYPHPMGGYGVTFAKWVKSDNPQPYGSWGNGAAMRVAPVGFGFDNLQDVIREAMKSAMCSHNDPEGILGAVAVAEAIYCLSYCNNERYVADIGLHVILKRCYGNYEGAAPGVFDETCRGTVPVALRIMQEAKSFEDAIRRAMQYGGDSDTLGAIVGGMAEALFGIPDDIKEKALGYLPEEMIEVINVFYAHFSSRNIC